MILRGKQLNGINAAIKSGGDVNAAVQQAAAANDPQVLNRKIRVLEELLTCVRENVTIEIAAHGDCQCNAPKGEAPCVYCASNLFNSITEVIKRTSEAYDLNVIHEAENTLEVGHDGSEADDYQQALWHITNPGVSFCETELHDVSYLQKMICATGAQRAEALRVIGKGRFSK